MTRVRFIGLLLLGALLATLAHAGAARAHEIRPAYLEITEIAPARYEMLWRTPLNAGMRLPVVVALPEDARNVSLPIVQERNDSIVERRQVEIPGGIYGRRIGLPGLETTITDALVRVQMLDGAYVTTLVRPSQPFIDIALAQGALDVARTYVVQGIEHILQGIDHLLFVLGLLLLVRDRWMLVKTITAFTVAHSLTLAAATFGLIAIPAAPLNAAIALSILFLGVEVMRARQGETSAMIRRPWLMAFGFGLLHGVGFASGLVVLGLPRGDVPLALLMFNIGVEIGQLAFVALILALEQAFRLLRVRWPRFALSAPAYLVGVLGAYWTIDRIAAMAGGV